MQTDVRTPRRGFYHRLTIAGALLAGAGTALYAATAIPAGDPRAPLFVPAALAAFGIAVLMRRTHKGLWVAAIGGPVLLGMFATDPFRLLHPDSFIDFVPSIVVVAGAALATAAGIAALVQWRRGREHTATGPEHAIIALGAIGLVAAAAYSAALTFTRPSIVLLPGGREATVVSADEDRWVPERVIVQSDALLVRNPDWIAHTFVVPELDIDLYLAPRSERVVEIGAADEQTYRFECGVTGHEAMVGSLVVP